MKERICTICKEIDCHSKRCQEIHKMIDDMIASHTIEELIDEIYG